MNHTSPAQPTASVATSMSKPQYSRFLVGMSLAIVAGLAIVGCSGNSQKPVTLDEDSAEMQAVDELSLAIEALREVAAANGGQSSERTLYYLNQWLSRQPVDATWKPDPLVQQIPRAYTIVPTLKELDSNFYSPIDLSYLQQNLWLHDVAARVAVSFEASTPAMEKWLAAQKLSGESLTQLRQAELLFDWTVRNIQLDPLPPEPKAPIATAGENTQPVLPSRRGEVGPGYAHMPYQTLLYGHGDAWERARIFMLLCRQLGIETAMLATDPAEGEGASIPWLPAVLIEKELYLFDTELGLPIPAAEATGIATLSQLATDPKLLEALVIDGTKYRVNADQLKTIVAFIDAEPEALSRRMATLEASLVGTQRLALTVKPSELEKKLRATARVGSVSLWKIPYAAFIYQIGQQEMLSQDPGKMTLFIRETQMFQGSHPLMQGRNLHIQGKFETVDQEKGARTIYLASRPPEAEIDLLSASDEVRTKAGLDRVLPEDKQQQEQVSATMAFIARRAKHHATYWMGITYYETGRYEAAAEWFRDRTQDGDGNSPWKSGAEYNLARSYESLGKIDEAIKLYRGDTSPQRSGNLLRAAMLEKQLAPAPAAETTTAETAPAATAGE